MWYGSKEGVGRREVRGGGHKAGGRKVGAGGKEFHVMPTSLRDDVHHHRFLAWLIATWAPKNTSKLVIETHLELQSSTIN